MTDKLFADRVKETGVGSGSAGLYDGSDMFRLAHYKASTLTGDAGATVAQWDDESGNSRHLLQATEANKPKIGTSLLNGYRFLTFDGSSDFMARTGGMGVSNVNASLHVFVVGRFRNLTNQGMFDLNDGSGTNEGTAFFAETSLKVRRDAANDSTSSGFSDTAGFHVFSITSTDARRELFIDGTSNGFNITSQAMTTTPTQLTIGSLAQGATYIGAVDIAEVLVIMNFDMTARLREQVEGTLAHKYGLAVNLPTAHTFKARPRPHIPPLLDTEFTLVDTDDTNRVVRLEIPATIANSGVPQTMTIMRRENIPDFTNLGGLETLNFTANWGGRSIINATGGDIIVTIPPCSAANSNFFINLTRVDASANTVTVIAPTNQPFFDSYIENVSIFTLEVGGTVNIRSLGTLPVITNINGVGSFSRLWHPQDLTTGPVIWLSFRHPSQVPTLTGSSIDSVTNLGSLGALTFTATGASRPTINSTTSPLYADFDGTDDRLVSGSIASMQEGQSGTVFCMYTQAAARNSSPYGQNPATGGQLTFHPKWGDDSITYLDMPITSARMSANVGTTFGGDANVYAMVGRRALGTMNIYARGNQTAAITRTGAIGNSTGSAAVSVGSNYAGAYHLGRIYEFGYIRESVTDANRDRLAAYMLWGAGEQAQIHTSNPHRLIPPTVTLATY